MRYYWVYCLRPLHRLPTSSENSESSLEDKWMILPTQQYAIRHTTPYDQVVARKKGGSRVAVSTVTGGTEQQTAEQAG